MRWLTNFYDFRLKWTATAAIGIHPTKAWWILKVQSDTLEELYPIKTIHQSWLPKGLGLGLLCWGFKGVQQEIPREEASTLQIGSVAFPPGQYTSPQLHPCYRLFDQDDGPYRPDLAPCDFCLFPKLRGCRYETIEEMKETVTKVIDTLTQEDFNGALQKLLKRYNKCIAAGGDYFEGD